MNSTTLNPVAALENFAILGDFISVKPFGSGHINDTFLATYDQAGVTLHYTLQHLNTNVFKDPVGLMDNVKRVTEHSRRSLLKAGTPEPSRHALKLVPTRKGDVLHFDENGQAWRCYTFVERTFTVDVVDSPDKAFEAARAFARFQALLADLPGGRLNETIPDFHNTPKRYAAFHAALEADKLGRAKDVRREIDFALAQEDNAGKCMRLLQSGEMPERATHNDTKINNVLLDEKTGEGICVIDLDTLMPGASIYDFGDMVRSATLNMEEDSKDYQNVVCRRDIFEALARGFVEAGDYLTPVELDNLTYGGMLMTLECGVRFLTDYLSGDVYFKIHRPEHNLDRCRTQFGLVQSILDQHDQLQGFVNGLRR